MQQISQPRRRSPGKLATTTFGNEIVDFVERVRPQIQTGQVDGRDRVGIPRWIKIASSAQDGSNFRWTYTVNFANRTATAFGAWTTEGSTFTAYNALEVMNGASGLMGNGVDTADLATTGLEIQPAPAGAIVRATFELDAWIFEYANGVTGPCEP